MEPSTPVTYLSFPVMKASLSADLAIACVYIYIDEENRIGSWLMRKKLPESWQLSKSLTFTHVPTCVCLQRPKVSALLTFSAMKEGSPLSVLRRPMTAARVPSSITSASVKAKSIYRSVSTVSEGCSSS